MFARILLKLFPPKPPSNVISGPTTLIERTTTFCEKTEPGLTPMLTEPTLMADCDWNPSGLPTNNPFNSPLPESIERVAPSSLTTVLVMVGPARSTPFFTMEPRKNSAPTRTSTMTRIPARTRRTTHFFIASVNVAPSIRPVKRGIETARALSGLTGHAVPQDSGRHSRNDFYFLRPKRMAAALRRPSRRRSLCARTRPRRGTREQTASGPARVHARIHHGVAG